MNYEKLHTSFIYLTIMSIIQFLTGWFLLHHLLITILSAFAFLLCLGGLIYTNNKLDSRK